MLQIAFAGLIWTMPAMGVDSAVLGEIRDILKEHALHEPDATLLNALEPGNINSGLQQIDSWAVLMDASNSTSANERPAGIGAELYATAAGLWLMPYADGPLMRAGVVDRVKLLSVEGQAVEGKPLADIVQLLGGRDGQMLRLEICRKNCDVPEVLSLPLETYRPRSIEQVTIEGQMVYRLRSFVSSETRVFLQSLLAAVTGEIPLLLDLRDCQGGDLYEAMDTAALFLPAGQELATALDRSGISQRYSSPDTNKIANPLTILISGNTASAGEIFAGILQAHGRARLVGMRSYGKCVSQTDNRLSDGSRLRYTNLEMVLPGGVKCQGVGLEPDLTLAAEELFDSRLLLQRIHQESQ